MKNYDINIAGGGCEDMYMFWGRFFILQESDIFEVIASLRGMQLSQSYLLKLLTNLSVLMVGRELGRHVIE